MKESSLLMTVDIGNSGIKVSKVNSGWSKAISGVQEFALPSLIGCVHRLEWNNVSTKYNAFAKSGADKSNDSLATSLQRIDDGMVDFVARIRTDEQAASAPRTDWWISSVQQQGLDSFLTAAKIDKSSSSESKNEFHIVTHQQVPMPIEIEYPERLGIDRLLAAWGASISHSWNSPIIVIQAGTAITVDLVSEDGKFQGGAIMPGVPLSFKLLAEGTDKLPWIASPTQNQEIPLPGRSTEQAMVAGVVASVRGGAEYLVNRYRKTFGSHLPVIISGGDGPFLADSVPQPVLKIDQLVLRSLGALAANSGRK